MKKKFINELFMFVVILLSVHVLAVPPSPPEGKIWIPVDHLSDEFDSSFDTSKWAKNSSDWAGRKPGLFMTEAVTMGDGNMRITADLLSTPYDGWTHQGGLVRSLYKAYDTQSPYFECRMKANKTFMSSTFWLINRSQDESGCDKRVTELDIDETVGFNSGGASWIDDMMRRMNSTTHSRNIPSGCSFQEASVGNGADIGELASANYHVYGCWWKSPTEILFYLDGQYVGTVMPAAPFTIGMNMQFVVETYDWNPPPADGGMTGSWADRTTYYDWVRTWELVDAPDCGGADALLIADVSGPSSVPDCTTDVYDLTAVDTSRSPHVKLRSLRMEDVKWTAGFWADRFELCRTAMLPTLHNTLLDPKCSAQLNRLKFTAGLIDENPGGVDWADGDCYKWIEAMAYVHSVRPDAKLDALMDEWIAVIAKAQDADGYISTNRGRDKAARLQMPYHHEMYNFGHLLTAACVHHRATGKTNFLAVATKLADFLHRTYQANPPRLVHFPWNPSVYMGLVEMYRTTGDHKCLETARIMIANRGTRPGGDHRNGGTDQTQDRVPLKKENEAVGHAVTGMYLYCGAADLYAETGDEDILRALERIWQSVALRKMDIAGSVAMGGGKSGRGDPVHEAFGPDYAQPNRYNETCANIGNAMFNYRMLSLTGDAKYADLMERVAYNGLNAAVDLRGERWFYCNPLNWQGQPGKGHHTGLRWRTNNCYCCPPSVARTTAKLHNWAYSLSDDGVWVNLYGGNTLATTLPGGTPVKLVQQTDYPWGGKVMFTVKQAGEKAFAVRLRIPGWAVNAALKVNGKPHPGEIRPGTYAKIHRAWAPGDVIELSLPMPVRLMEAHPKAKKLRNTVAVMRGPIVYCLELPKNEGGERVWRDGVFLPENIELTPEHRKDLLGGVTVLIGNALTFKGRDAFRVATAAAPAPAADADGPLYRPFAPRVLREPNEGIVKISLIPYYAWANRGPAYMEVWMPLAR